MNGADEEEVKSDKMLVWIVIRSPGSEGKPEISQAFFNEDNARYAASQLVGVDSEWVALKTIEIQDRPR